MEPAKVFQCLECQATFPTFERTIGHLQSHNHCQTVCNECNQPLRSWGKNQPKRHEMQADHDIALSGSFFAVRDDFIVQDGDPSKIREPTVPQWRCKKHNLIFLSESQFLRHLVQVHNLPLEAHGVCKAEGCKFKGSIIAADQHRRFTCSEQGAHMHDQFAWSDDANAIEPLCRQNRVTAETLKQLLAAARAPLAPPHPTPMILYQCPDCCRLFPSWSKMDRHMIISKHATRFCVSCGFLDAKGEHEPSCGDDHTTVGRIYTKTDLEVLVDPADPRHLEMIAEVQQSNFACLDVANVNPDDVELFWYQCTTPTGVLLLPTEEAALEHQKDAGSAATVVRVLESDILRCFPHIYERCDCCSTPIVIDSKHEYVECQRRRCLCTLLTEIQEIHHQREQENKAKKEQQQQQQQQQQSAANKGAYENLPENHNRRLPLFIPQSGLPAPPGVNFVPPPPPPSAPGKIPDFAQVEALRQKALASAPPFNSSLRAGGVQPPMPMSSVSNSAASKELSEAKHENTEAGAKPAMNPDSKPFVPNSVSNDAWTAALSNKVADEPPTKKTSSPVNPDSKPFIPGGTWESGSVSNAPSTSSKPPSIPEPKSQQQQQTIFGGVPKTKESTSNKASQQHHHHHHQHHGGPGGYHHQHHHSYPSHAHHHHSSTGFYPPGHPYSNYPPHQHDQHHHHGYYPPAHHHHHEPVREYAYPPQDHQQHHAHYPPHHHHQHHHHSSEEPPREYAYPPQHHHHHHAHHHGYGHYPHHHQHQHHHQHHYSQHNVVQLAPGEAPPPGALPLPADGYPSSHQHQHHHYHHHSYGYPPSSTTPPAEEEH